MKKFRAVLFLTVTMIFWDCIFPRFYRFGEYPYKKGMDFLPCLFLFSNPDEPGIRYFYSSI